MPDVYARQFDLVPRGSVDPLAAFSTAIRAWVGPRWPNARPWFDVTEMATFKAEDGSIFRWEPFVDGNRALIDFSWRHGDTSEPTESWSTTATYVGLPERSSVTIQVTNTMAGAEGSPRKLTTRPRLIHHLIDKFVVRGAEGELRTEPQRLRQADMPFFVRYDLFDPTRQYSILVLTPDENGAFAVEPGNVGSEFVSLAKVFQVETPDATFALTRELGRKELSVFRGAARLYGPRLRRDSDPRQHPLVFPSRLADASARVRLAEVLALATARQGVSDHAVPILRDERAVQAEHRRAAKLEALRAQGSSTVDEWSRIAEAYAAENRNLLVRIRDLEKENAILENKVRALQYSLAQREADVEAAEPELVDFGPTSVLEAVELANELYSDDMTLLPSAIVAAEKSPYRRVDELARTLTIMADVSARLKEGPIGRQLKEEFATYGIDYRPRIAQTSSRRTREQHKFVHEGDTVFCEEHICLGGATYAPEDCLRIYFVSDVGKGIVVGHIGRHLDTDRTT